MALTELKRRILSIRRRAFNQIRQNHPAMSIRQARFQAKVWTEMEIRRRKTELRKKARADAGTPVS